MSTNSNKENSMQWLCESLTSKKYGFKPFETSMKRECFICGFKDYLQVHHIIPLAKEGDHCEENVVMLCLNHHRMAHDKEQDSIKLPLGKKRKYTTKEIKDLKEKEEALLEATGIYFRLTIWNDVKDEEERIKLTQNLGYLFKKYDINAIDCLSHQLGIKRESFIRQYILKDNGIS